MSNLLKMFRISPPSQASGPARSPQDETSRQERLRIVSFYTRGGYYEERARDLRAQCDRLGLLSDIVPIDLDEGEDWARICRRKVGFYREMLHKHRAPVMWVDVDAILLRNVESLARGDFDIALFLRNFKYLPRFNVSTLARTFHPGYLLFRHTPRTIRFLDDALAVERRTRGAFTDDYILEETFRRSQEEPRLLLMSPRDILRPGEPDNEDALFRHGDSGNVKDYKGKVLQHRPRALSAESQKAVVMEIVRTASRGGGKRDYVVFLLRHLLDVDPTDLQTYLKLLDILKRAKYPIKLAAEIERGMATPALRPHALRFQLIAALDEGDWDRAETLYQDILATGDARVAAFARSRMFRHDLDRRARAAGVDEDRRVDLFWWEEPHPGNLGDIVNPYIVEGLTGIPPRYAPRGAGLCAIGSVIKYARAGTPVWGSGSPHAEDDLAPDADYRAVRGPLTRDLVLRNGGTCPEVYGDAAWFLPILYRPEVARTHRTGLILHFTHETAPLDIDPAIRRIDIRRLGYDEIEAFLDEMLSCERIVSSSLHGVIIANAYGIPACLATVSGAEQQIHGDGIKFRDYYASIGVEDPPAPLDLSRFDRITDATFRKEHFVPPRRRIDLPRLIDVAPFAVRPEMRARAEAFMRDGYVPDGHGPDGHGTDGHGQDGGTQQGRAAHGAA